MADSQIDPKSMHDISFNALNYISICQLVLMSFESDMKFIEY